jgi:hypothetical protein
MIYRKHNIVRRIPDDALTSYSNEILCRHLSESTRLPLCSLSYKTQGKILHDFG